MHRSAALILLLLCVGPLTAAELCAFPGRDGDRQLAGVVNRWLPAAEGVSLAAGDREISVAADWRGRGALQPGDLLLLVQMQDAQINSSNDDAYGDGEYGDGQGRGATAIAAGRFEFLRLESIDGQRLQVRGAGENGGLLHAYPFQLPSAGAAQGARRWQLVRVPQFENLTLTDDLTVLPWDGRSGGVLALDVRRRLHLSGHRLDARGAGFRGGAALTLLGALGDEYDFRYRAPQPDELRIGFGQHAAKGEGMAGTPRWVRQGDGVLDSLPDSNQHSSDGYPQGSMAKGAPANAGGGGVSLSADNSQASGGGGGAGGESGGRGLDAAGKPRGGFGGAAVAADLLAVIAGGGGGAGTRSGGKGGDGASGGGIVVVRAGMFDGPGVVDIRGADAGPADEAGGGGGGGGSLWLQAPFGDAGRVRIDADGGAGGAAPARGGHGGAGRLLYGGGLVLADTPAASHDRLTRDTVTGVSPGYRCRPAGMLLGGSVFDDNGAGQGVAHDGRRQKQEQALAGLAVRVLDAAGGTVKQTRTSPSGQFALELPEQLAGTPLQLAIEVKPGWFPVLARSNDLPLAPFRYSAPGRWQFIAQKEYLQDGLVLAMIRQPDIEVPTLRTVEAGSTQFFLFRYLPRTRARARLHYRGELSGASDWQHAFFIDPDCDGASEYVEQQTTGWIPVQPQMPVCVRVRVDVPPGSTAQGQLTMRVDVETDLGDTALSTRLPTVNASIDVRLAR